VAITGLAVFNIPIWDLCKNPLTHYRVSDGRSSMPLSSLLFSVLHTSGRSSLCSLSYPRDIHDHLVSFKDFSECFPLWCEEQPNGAEGIFNTVSSFIETHIVVRFSLSRFPALLSSSTHIHPTEIAQPPCYFPPSPPGARHRFILPFFHFGDGNTRPIQTSYSNNMMSKKTWIFYTKW
jgi:hypothetical protein